ncbi:MAG: methylenetetrahydrofolate reductase [Oscillospiraceae bacterium]|nr:methylenetetrahydrofolate reductase [Oscillospiraceae bacterium]
MKNHIEEKRYHIEIIPPKHNTEDLEKDMETFAEKYNRVMESGYCACITDNAMGRMAFQGHEMISELELPVNPEQVMIHLNTFHSKEKLIETLDTLKDLGVKYILVVSGDGGANMNRLEPKDIGSDALTVTSVELVKFIRANYPDFVLGVAFNPYEPEEAEFAKMERKLAAGATFIITQPILGKNGVFDKLLEKYPDIPIIAEAWMSKRAYLLSDVVGYEIPTDADYDPVATLKELVKNYPQCGFYLSILGFKTQYPLIGDIWK